MIDVTMDLCFMDMIVTNEVSQYLWSVQYNPDSYPLHCGSSGSQH